MWFDGTQLRSVEGISDRPKKKKKKLCVRKTECRRTSVKEIMNKKRQKRDTARRKT